MLRPKRFAALVAKGLPLEYQRSLAVLTTIDKLATAIRTARYGLSIALDAEFTLGVGTNDIGLTHNYLQKENRWTR